MRLRVLLLGLELIGALALSAAAQPRPRQPDGAAARSDQRAVGRDVKADTARRRTGDKRVEQGKPGKRRKRCPRDMASVEGRFCIDRYEAYTVEIKHGGLEREHSPYAPVVGKIVKARNGAGHVPQGYVGREDAERACNLAGKRLCTDGEWVGACKGGRPTQYPYGNDWEPSRCNDHGVSSFNHYYGSAGEPPPQSAHSWKNLNDPRLNRLPGTLARSGRHRRCRNGYGLFDMVGNLQEWTADPAGTLRGGYYADARPHGDGCDHYATAPTGRYRDYSTGFRCCK